jgi:tyrosyl-tRNA synthetase
MEYKAYKAVDYIQYAWKQGYDIEKSKSQIRRDLEQGAVKLNDRKIMVDDVFVFEVKEDECSR